MSVAITATLSSATADPADIRVVKAALNRLGLYRPDPAMGITAFTDAALFDGIRAFQQQKKLPVTGMIRPDDDTVRALERAVEDIPLGERYVWRTVQDDKVRSAHAARNGQIFTEGRPPQGGHPGEEFGCRCWRETVTDKELYPDAINSVYPELLIASVLPISRLLRAGLKLIRIQKIEYNLERDTKHGAIRIGERKITDAEIKQAIETANKTKNITEKSGKYGTAQKIYKGSNNVTVIIEQEGRNAGKIITVYRH